MDEVDKAQEKKRRRVVPKKLYICQGSDDVDIASATQFEVVAGPCKTLEVAVKLIKDELPAGQYVLMYEGKSFAKQSVNVTKVQEV